MGKKKEGLRLATVLQLLAQSADAKILDMATTVVEFDTDLLKELRQDAPGKSDRELLEDLAAIKLGDDAIARIQAAFVDVSQEEIEREAVRAVHDTRRERPAKQAAS